MEKKLNEILDGAVAIPYGDELLSQLVTTCRSYSKDNLYDKIDLCSLSFITGVVSEDFSDYVTNSLIENKSELKKLPMNVLMRLSLFSVYLTILEEKDELKQHLYATMFMNAMIFAKGRWNYIPNGGIIQEIYKYHISFYLERHDTAGDELSSSIITEIANSNTYCNEHTLDDIELDDLQTIAKHAELYRCDKLLHEISTRKISDPFDRVYKIITKLVDSYQYLYYNYDVTDYIMKVTHGETKSKMLSNILKELESTSRNLNSDTSVLLRIINGEEFNNSDSLQQKKLNVMEFGLYLYYELLVERIIEKIEE